MDPTNEIKARLPIEELVGQYCQLNKKGRGYMCLCPFHNDTKPSLQVSPDKGIAYCFACSTGGDIFSFYEAIEGVDFRQALKDLADKTGVKLPEMSKVETVNKDEKDRIRECLQTALEFYKKNLKENPKAVEYLKSRQMPAEQAAQFSLGVAPDSFSATYEHLLKAGFSKTEILAASLGVQKDLAQGKIYDRFRNRLMFPIHDHQGKLVAFGGRTLGEDDAKYINSSDGPLYNKSAVLYGFHYAKESLRETKTVIMVEGYFDVIACHRVGVKNVVAVSGTALTEQHVKLLKRHCETVVLCLDQDRAGQEAAERAFHLCSEEGLHVQAVTLAQKDPDEAANADPEELKRVLKEDVTSYIEHVLKQIGDSDLSSMQAKRQALQRVLPLLQSIQSSSERAQYIEKAAVTLGVTPKSLEDDMLSLPKQNFSAPPPISVEAVAEKADEKSGFSKVELTLGLFLLHPQLLSLLSQLIEPPEEFAAALYKSLQELPETKQITVDMLTIPEEFREKAGILQLYCEHHGFADWSESIASREIKHNCSSANKAMLKDKLLQIKREIIRAQAEGKKAELEQLTNQLAQISKLTSFSK